MANMRSIRDIYMTGPRNSGPQGIAGGPTRDPRGYGTNMPTLRRPGMANPVSSGGGGVVGGYTGGGSVGGYAGSGGGAVSRPYGAGGISGGPTREPYPMNPNTRYRTNMPTLPAPRRPYPSNIG